MKELVKIYNPETKELRTEILDYWLIIHLTKFKEEETIEINGKTYKAFNLGKFYLLRPITG